jgi:hypothetical protein
MLSSGSQSGAALSQQPALQLGEPAIAQLLTAALHAGDQAEQGAADMALEAVYTGSPAAQAVAVFGLSGAGGQELARALSSSDPEASSRAASVVSYIVRGNAEARQHLAQLLAQELAHCTRQLASLLLAPQHDLARQQALRFVRLLLSWLPACTPAVAAFLQAATARPFLVGVVSGTQCSDLVLRGLVAILLGLCALARREAHPSPPSAVGVPTSAMLMDVIVGQIGLEEFRGLLGAPAHRLVIVGSGVGMAPDLIPSGSLVSLSYFAYVTGLVEEVMHGLAHPSSRAALAEVPQQQCDVPQPAPPLEVVCAAQTAAHAAGRWDAGVNGNAQVHDSQYVPNRWVRVSFRLVG